MQAHNLHTTRNWRLCLQIAFLLQLFSFSVLAQTKIQISVLDKNTKIAINEVAINTYCNGKLQQYLLTKDQAYVALPDIIEQCTASVSASGYETNYNINLQANKTNTIFLTPKNTALQEVVITGHAKNVLAENSIYRVQLIGEKKLQQLATQNIADALQYETGLNQQQDNLLGSSVNMQGIGSQNVKVLLNGMPINGRENGNIDLNTISTHNVERIEYIKGPMSVLYGTDALGGVINIITKSVKKSLLLKIYAESINKFNANLSVSYIKKRHTIGINGTRNFFGGWNYLDSFNRKMLWRPKLQYLADLNYTYAFAKGKISYTPSFMHEKIIDKGTPYIDPFSAFASDEYFNTNRHIQRLDAEYQIDSIQKITANASASIYNRTRNRYAINLLTLNKELTNNVSDQDTTNFTDYNVRLVYNKENSKKLDLLIGAELMLQTANSLKIMEKKQSISDIAIFISAPFALNKNWKVQPAIRVAKNSSYTAPILPSINFSKKLKGNNILRFTAAKGYRAPSLKEMYLNFVDVNHQIYGNDSLQAENSWHLQTNLDYKLLQKAQSNLLLNTNIYFNKINNQIALAAVDLQSNRYKYANIDNFKNIAAECNIKWKNKNAFTTLGFTNNYIISADSGRGINAWDVSLQENISLGKHKTMLNVFYKYIHKQPILTLSTYGSDALYTSYLPSLHQADANISQTFWKEKCNVQLGVKNIFNLNNANIIGSTNSGIHTNGTSQNLNPGRSVFLSASYTL